MAAAEGGGVHQQARSQDVREFRARCRPRRAQNQHQRNQAGKPEYIAQAEESEGRRVLQADLGGDETRTPDADEIPGEQGVEPAAPGYLHRCILTVRTWCNAGNIASAVDFDAQCGQMFANIRAAL